MYPYSIQSNFMDISQQNPIPEMTMNYPRYNSIPENDVMTFSQHNPIQQINTMFFPSNEYGTVTFFQPNIVVPALETVTLDNISPVNEYPFDTTMDKIYKIELKLNDTTITINNTSIVANKPILIECIGGTLRVWNLTFFPNNVIGTKGNLYIDGYNLLDFDNKNIKSKYIYELKTWVIDISIIKNMAVHGSYNNIYINQLFSNDVVIKNNGKNVLHIKKIQIHVRSLIINNIDGNIDLDSSVCDNFMLENKGIGVILDLGISLVAEIKIIGSSVMTLNKLKNTVCKETINGTGKIIWNVID